MSKDKPEIREDRNIPSDQSTQLDESVKSTYLPISDQEGSPMPSVQPPANNPTSEGGGSEE